MTEMQMVMTLTLSLAVPFSVQLIKTEAMSGTGARFMAIALSLIAGVVTGFVSGIPSDPASWVTCVFALVGGVQTAYTLFKGVGVTSKWLDALLGVEIGGRDE